MDGPNPEGCLRWLHETEPKKYIVAVALEIEENPDIVNNYLTEPSNMELAEKNAKIVATTLAIEKTAKEVMRRKGNDSAFIEIVRSAKANLRVATSTDKADQVEDALKRFNSIEDWDVYVVALSQKLSKVFPMEEDVTNRYLKNDENRKLAEGRTTVVLGQNKAYAK